MAPETACSIGWPTAAATITGYGDLPSPPRPSGAAQLFDAARRRPCASWWSAQFRRGLGARARCRCRWARPGVRESRRAGHGQSRAGDRRAVGLLRWWRLACTHAFRPVRVERELCERPTPRRACARDGPDGGGVEPLHGTPVQQQRDTARIHGGAAHQMRTPLAALRAQAQLALDDDDPEAPAAQAIERNATHMSRLLNQLLSDASVIHRSHLRALQRWTWPRPCTRPCMKRCRRPVRRRACSWR